MSCCLSESSCRMRAGSRRDSVRRCGWGWMRGSWSACCPASPAPTRTTLPLSDAGSACGRASATSPCIPLQVTLPPPPPPPSTIFPNKHRRAGTHAQTGVQPSMAWQVSRGSPCIAVSDAFNGGEDAFGSLLRHTEHVLHSSQILLSLAAANTVTGAMYHMISAFPELPCYFQMCRFQHGMRDPACPQGSSPLDPHQARLLDILCRLLWTSQRPTGGLGLPYLPGIAHCFGSLQTCRAIGSQQCLFLLQPRARPVILLPQLSVILGVRTGPQPAFGP